MSLVGPFPTTFVIETREQAELLLGAIGAHKRLMDDVVYDYPDDPDRDIRQAEADLLDKLYANVLSACGDD